MGLVKVETQAGGTEGEADNHNKFQFFTKPYLDDGKMLSHCDLQFKETILLRKTTDSC